MFVLIVLFVLLVIPAFIVSRWLTARARAKEQRGFEVKLNPAESHPAREEG